MKKEDFLISIITPYYKALEEIKKLASVLKPQLNENIEWIIIDDGCNEKELDNIKAKIIHLEKNSGGASIPRNKGLDLAKGKYITFIDSDDLVSDKYIETLLNKLQEDFDYCFISWCSKHYKVIIENEPPEWNCCVWNCIYKKELIADARFDPIYKKGEDFDFNKRVRKGKRSNITEVLYYYNENNPYSLSKQNDYYNTKMMNKGELK